MEAISNLEEEILRFAETIYKCKLCTVVPSLHGNKAQFLKHFKGLHVSGQPTIYRCSGCLLKFGSEDDLEVHKKVCRSGEAEDQEEEEEEARSPLSSASSDGSPVKEQNNPENEVKDAPEMENGALKQEPQVPKEKQDAPKESVIEEPASGADQSVNTSIDHAAEKLVQKSLSSLPSRQYSASPQRPSINKLCIRSQPGPDSVECTRENIKLQFGHFASTIISKGMLYFFCKICVFKCSRDWEFGDHMQSGDHARMVLAHGPKLASLPPKCVPPRSSHKSHNNQRSTENYQYPIVPDMRPSAEEKKQLSQLYSSNALQYTSARGQATHTNGKVSHRKASKSLSIEPNADHRMSSTVLYSDRKRLWTDHKAKQLTPGAKTRKLVEGSGHGAASSSLTDLEKLVGTIPMKKTDCPGPEDVSAVSENREMPSPKKPHKCAMCDYVYHDFDEYLKHCFEMHESMPESRQQFSESFKLATVVKYLPELLTESATGVVSRQELLERMGQLIGEPDAIYWSTSSNKAFREIFPRGLVQRKGKFKETYYFGVRFKSSAEDGSVEDEESIHEDDGPPLLPNYSPLRDMTKDVDKLMSILPNLVYWRGNMERSVARDTILYTVKQITEDAETLEWGVQCNRTIRQLFPDVSIQRKGRFKTTCYFGVELIGAETAEGDNPKLDHGWKSWRHIPPPIGNVKAGEEEYDEEEEEVEENVEETENCPENSKESTEATHQVHTVAEVHAPPDEIIIKQEVIMPDEEIVETSHSPCPDAELSIDFQEEEEEMEDSDNSYSVPSESTILDPHNESLTFRHRHENNLQKIIMLHPGPFVTTRIICRHFRRLTPTVYKALDDMQGLEEFGLGQLVTLKLGNCKAFFKALPSRDLEEGLQKFGIKLVDYRLMFQERDPKLNEKLHERLRNAYPWPEDLGKFYPY